MESDLVLVTVLPVAPNQQIFEDIDEGLAKSSFRVTVHGCQVFVAAKTPSTWPTTLLQDGDNVIGLHWDELSLALLTADIAPVLMILIDPAVREIAATLQRLKKYRHGAQSRVLV